MKKLLGVLIPALVLMAVWTGQAEAGSQTEDVYAIVIFGSPFPLAVIGLTIYRILKRRYLKEMYTTAIAQGQPPPEMEEPTRSDMRKPGIVLIALGAGFFIATTVTLSYVTKPDAPVPIQVSIWGIVPALIGAAMWYYDWMVRKEMAQSGGVGDRGTGIGER